ncbi:hypothetical protein MMC22_000901 [Lobaria immixta]|nr:hypothetical protein [Lobaria immixta]
MAVAMGSPIFQSLKTETANSWAMDTARTAADPQYWWNTSGRDISNMLNEANYPEEVQHHFLIYFRNTICPQLGSRPDGTSIKSPVGWDGNPFEYSFELKSSAKAPAVRFVVDLSQLRPADNINPLSMATAQKVVDSLAERAPGFDNTWYHALKRWFCQSHLPTSEQQALIAKVGHQSTMAVGFDVYPRISAPGRLPIMGKVYFSPSFTAAAKGITSWQSTRLAILQLPDIDSQSNILQSLGLIENYLSDKPSEWENGARYLATDFVDPSKARLKIYMRHPGKSFDEIWDCYTLGGRIPGHEDDKEKFRDLMDLTSGTRYDTEIEKQRQPDQSPHTSRQKTTVIAFSLSAENQYPTPKLGIHPANFAPNDEIIARGLDEWSRKYEWYDGEKSIEQRVKSVFTHRKLDEETGIFTFIGIGRKDDPSKKGLSMQVYITPELYKTPRVE